MIIEKPYLRTEGEYSYLTTLVTDEVAGVTKEIYFSVSAEYGQYLTPEVADAFVVAMLLPATVTGQDITVKAPVSDMLFYQSGNALTYLFAKMFGKKPIRLIPQSTLSPHFAPAAVATAFSGGVDSFYTLLQHTSAACPGSLRLSHLTLFNVGAYGNRDEARGSFQRDSRRAAVVAEKMNLPLVLLDSNISAMHNHPDIYPFSTRYFNNIAAGVLALQKLFKVYLLASGVPTDFLKVDPGYRDQGWHDVLLAAFLSNDNTRLLISGSNIMRLGKIRYLAGLTDTTTETDPFSTGVEGMSLNDNGHPARTPTGNGISTGITDPALQPEDAGMVSVAAPQQQTHQKQAPSVPAALVQENLYVCQADVYNEKYGMGFTKDTSPNCSECDKCTRTLLALELLGCINDFAPCFDLRKWERVKHLRLAKDLANYHTDPFSRELLDLAAAIDYPLPLRSRLMAFRTITRKRLRKIRLLKTVYRRIRFS